MPANLRMRWLVIRQTARRRRHLVVNVALICLGLGGALAGGWVIGWWCLGVVAIAESAGLVYVGMARDDGEALPVRGARTVEAVLEDERLRP
jgi:hypothetical protein